VSAHEAQVNLMQSVFHSNIAEGLGGGALHLQNLPLFMFGMDFQDNSAISGGGGVLFWQSSLFSTLPSLCPPAETDLIHSCSKYSPSYTCSWRTCTSEISTDTTKIDSICQQDNFALYGSCIASDYKQLELLQLQEQIFPGLSFSLIAVKTDAYNQTILSDSASVLQAYLSVENTLEHSVAFIGAGSIAKYTTGKATFTLSIKATGWKVTSFSDTALGRKFFIGVEGSDSQTGNTMRSNLIRVEFLNGISICPSGYILELDLLPTFANGTATCSFCKTGTYSINPLANAPDTSNSGPACIPCPAGGDCSQGGSVVHFEVGDWLAVDGIFYLQSCPRGSQLINSSTGGSVGLFSNVLQQCRQCPSGKYIINPNMDECQGCSAGKNNVVIPLY